jgi:MiaB/RimO family radical SAM methylthiotransferase
MLEKQEKTGLPELLKEILGIEKDFFLRLGMMNPEHVLPVLDELIKVYKNKKIFKFLHLPVQSGNDSILGLMKRRYHVDDFRKIISEFREDIPGITISTDIIVGFPTETDAQFQDSLNLVKELRPDVLNISRFQPRYGTEAAKMEGQVDGGVSKDRSRLLTDIFTNISRMNNERWIGWEGDILIDEKGKDGSWVGRNFAYKPIIIKGDHDLGEIVKVKVENITPYDLRAIVL